MNGCNRIAHEQSTKTCKASITVEAAFVMPIVLLAIFTILYLTFYLHDMCRVQGIVDETLHRAGLSMKNDTDLTTVGVDYESIKDRGVYGLLPGDKIEVEQKLNSYLQLRLAKGLFLFSITDAHAKVEITKLTISVQTESRIKIPWTAQFFRKYSTRVISGEYPIHDPAQTIRICEVILDTAAKVKGVDELKDKIEKFIPADAE